MIESPRTTISNARPCGGHAEAGAPGVSGQRSNRPVKPFAEVSAPAPATAVRDERRSSGSSGLVMTGYGLRLKMFPIPFLAASFAASFAPSFAPSFAASTTPSFPFVLVVAFASPAAEDAAPLAGANASASGTGGSSCCIAMDVVCLSAVSASMTPASAAWADSLSGALRNVRRSLLSERYSVGNSAPMRMAASSRFRFLYLPTNSGNVVDSAASVSSSRLNDFLQQLPVNPLAGGSGVSNG